MVWFPGWTTNPIPGVSLSAGGLLALADLSTVAQRTAITGGSSWLDVLLLAPGLHYQQAADELSRWSGGATRIVDAIEDYNGKATTFRVNNAATALYIRRIARPGQVVTLDVGALPIRTKRKRGVRYLLKRSESGMHATVWTEDDLSDLGWLSHLLYLTSPVLTVAALVLVILFQDWWTLASLLGLMLSRILNIWVIKQRTNPLPGNPDAAGGGSQAQPSTPPHPATPPTSNDNDNDNNNSDHLHDRLTEYIVSLKDGNLDCAVKLRGMSADLQAVTVDAWLRSKTHIEGYLEAAAKLCVWLVAAFSGNMTQVGAIIMMVLLVATAGLLALSNANAKSFTTNGRVTAPESLLKAAAAKGKILRGVDGGGAVVGGVVKNGWVMTDIARSLLICSYETGVNGTIYTDASVSLVLAF
ncbi:hypothetical protein B0T17DRAFT_588385 [Bombardia bombarda]|uniref:Uncharacterized protein n=1 Tax=Bombardia bombarda TaxID=252184 RepID=A0AA39X6G8_9PEZI|nr:hypothetical protein B0T17DRAFT_588385 [Bombardia bombarda]